MRKLRKLIHWYDVPLRMCCENIIGEQLTTAEKRSIITQVKQEFKGLKR